MMEHFTFLYFREPFTSYRLMVLPQGKPTRRPTVEVKPYPGRGGGLQLGWVNLKKYPVLYSIFFLSLPSPFFLFMFISDDLDPSPFVLTVSLFLLRN